MKTISGQEQLWNFLKEKGNFKNFANYSEWEKRGVKEEKKPVPIKKPNETFRDWYDKLPLEEQKKFNQAFE